MIQPAKHIASATLDDLYNHPGKAELIGGRIVTFMATGGLPGRIAVRVLRELADFADRTGAGEAFGDNIGFAVPRLPSGRETFSPDAAYIGEARRIDMRFIEGAPTFAVEVRSESDYAPGADDAMAAKRSDYFAAGTRVVWDVDTLNACIHAYRAEDPARPLTFRRGAEAHAEPAVPGWRVAANRIFA